MAISCLKARIADGITDREMVDDMSLFGRKTEITVHLLIVERDDAGRSWAQRTGFPLLSSMGPKIATDPKLSRKKNFPECPGSAYPPGAA